MAQFQTFKTTPDMRRRTHGGGTMTSLSDTDVLTAVRDAAGPMSIYIAAHLKHMGKPVSARRLLRRMRVLESNGLLACSTWTWGYYGYEWTITPAGRAALKEGRDE